MLHLPYVLTRRRFVNTIALGAATLATRGVFADELTRTPKQTEGPFYPDKLPLDTDNDLLVINDSITSAVGEVTHLTGRILDLNGNPLRNAIVEIWQADQDGIYLHSKDRRIDERDGQFQGFGRFTTGTRGEYYFRTIKPVPYGGRAPHIHYAVQSKGMERLVTQCYIKGHERNKKDGPLNGVKAQDARESLLVDFKPLENSTVGELQANFDIVLGFTPPDDH